MKDMKNSYVGGGMRDKEGGKRRGGKEEKK